MPVRKERNRVLRELAERKNFDFRQRFIGRTLSVVTLAEGALSDNFIKVELAGPRPANQLVDIRIGSITKDSLREHELLRVL